VIFPRSQPANQVSFRLVVKAGSVDETDSERGLAHFVEHMVFNGTTHYPPGSLENFLGKNSLALGPDANADTHYGYTNYRFDLPKAENVSDWLQLLRDFADGATFERNAVEREKKVILAEARMRDTSDYRVWRDCEETVMRGSSLAGRPPIGLREVVDSARPEQLKKFYQRLYRPDRMELIVAGDVDAAVVEKQIHKTFSSFSRLGSSEERPRPEFARETSWRAGTTRSDLHNGNVFSLIAVSAPKPVHTEDELRHAFLAKVAEKIFDLRLQRLAEADPQKISFCNVQISDEPTLTNELICQISPREPEWQDAARRLQLELRASLEQGFSRAEIDEMLQIALGVTADRASQEGGISDAEEANLLVNDYLDEHVTRSLAQNLADIKRYQQDATPENLLTAWRETWNGWRIGWLQLGQNFPKNPTGEEMLEMLDKNSATLLPEHKDAAAFNFPYDHFGPSGEVVSRHRLENLDTEEIVFKNGLRLFAKKTTYAPNSATITLRVGNGRLSEPADKPGLGTLAAFWILGGVRQMRFDDLSRFLTSHIGEFSVIAGSDALRVTNDVKPEQQLTYQQVLAAYLTDAAFAENRFPLVLQDVLSRETQLWDGSQGILQEEVGPREHAHDTRYFSARRQDMEKYQAADVTTWLQSYLKTSDVTLIVVGDIDLDKVIGETAQTLGAIALPGGVPLTPPDQPKWVTWTEKPDQTTYNYVTRSPVSVVCVDWSIREPIDAQISARAKLLSQIMTERARAKIRQDRGQSYVAEFAFTALPGPQGGWIRFFSDCKAEDVPRIVDESVALLKTFWQKGATTAELTRAKNVLLASAETDHQKNEFWAELLSNRVLSSSTAERELEFTEKVRSTQTADLDAFARKYLRLDTAFVSRIIAQPPKKN
jgi:zinc protease